MFLHSHKLATYSLFGYLIWNEKCPLSVQLAYTTMKTFSETKSCYCAQTQKGCAYIMAKIKFICDDCNGLTLLWSLWPGL